MKLKKNEKGITLTALAITIVVLMMIAVPTVVNVSQVGEADKFTKFKDDITNLNESISELYGSDVTLSESNIGPAYTGTTNFLNYSEGNVDNPSEAVKNPNDNDKYYIINVNRLASNLSTKLGISFKNLTYGEGNYNISKSTEDVYIINAQSRTIYYPKGINYESSSTGKKYIYYRLPGSYTEINVQNY